MKSAGDFWYLLWRSAPGERVRLELEREGQPVVADLVLVAPAQG